MKKFFDMVLGATVALALVAPAGYAMATIYSAGSLLQTGDVKTEHILNGTITNADVSNTAAISATKIAGGSNSGLLMLSTNKGMATSTLVSFATSTNTLNVTGNLAVTATTTLNGVSYAWPSADGTSGQVVQTNGAGRLSWTDSGRTLLYATTTDVTISNTAATTTLLTFTVPSNTLSTGNVIKGHLNISGGTYGFSVLNANSITVKVLYGSTEIAVATVTPSSNFENGTVGNYAAVDFVVAAKGTTSSQEGYITLTAERTDTQYMLRSTAVGSASEDSTANKTLSVVAKYSAASVNNSMNMANAYVEILK